LKATKRRLALCREGPGLSHRKQTINLLHIASNANVGSANLGRLKRCDQVCSDPCRWRAIGRQSIRVLVGR